MINVSKTLRNLANLLQQNPARLSEARQLAEEALAIDKTLNPAAAEIWTTYQILAEITEQQGDTAQIQAYRRQAREARANFAGTQHQLKQLAPLVMMIVGAAQDAEKRKQFEPMLKVMEQLLEANFVTAIRRIFDGERDEEVLSESLGQEGVLISAILRGLDDPAGLAGLAGTTAD